MKENKSYSIKFSLEDGYSPNRTTKRRMLSNMKEMYLDNEAFEFMLERSDICIYEFYELGIPEKSSELAFGTTIIYPGKVGNEYFMTKGHFHEVLETAEVYYCTKGHGFLLMEDPEGRTEIQEMTPGISVYVPPNFAHRSINISNTEPFIMFFVFRADAGHDYKTIETKGFRKLVVEMNGKPEIIDNPKWEI
ncbi:MAG: glucose-6-phosphate isomerase [Candidatus Lokiarchaeota archaeon]|nr:glucose-6-phosphate isomerase [Candidatus Lokiarchaeota archaeon]